MKKLIASVAAAGLAVTPLIAQANTRSADSNVALSASPLAAERLGAPIGDSEQIVEQISPFLLAIIIGGVVVAIIELADSKGIFD